MKKTLFLFAIILLLAALAGCSQTAKADTNSVSVVATIFAPFDFAREVAGEKAVVTMLLPAGAESHSYEPTPADIITIQNCDVFIYTGGESDGWVDGILSSMDTENMQIVKMLDCVSAVEEQLVDGMEHGEEDENEPEYDEHVWTSPLNAKLIAEKIFDALCEADGQNSSYYEENTTGYLKKLDDLDAAFQSVVDGAKRRTIVFGDRFPFRYFADAYGVECYAAFPGCSSETEPSAATVMFLINKINDEKIPVVFHVQLSSKKMAETISGETGAKVLLLHACHNISKNDFADGITYLELMTRNVDALKEALW